jgi:hypothetical protein
VTLDVSNLSPSDAVAALRSFPRRFRTVLALVDEDDDSVLRRPGPDGLSAIEHAEAADRDLASAGQALRQALGAAGPPEGGDDAESLAELAGHVAADDWGRPGEGGTAALDLLREAVRVAAGHLGSAERARAGR